MTARYDILMLADPHGPAAQAEDLVEEIAAAYRAGYTLAMIDVTELLDEKPPPFDEGVRRCIREGMIDLLPARTAVGVRLALVRAPASLSRVAKPLRIDAERVVAVADEISVDVAEVWTPDGYGLERIEALVGKVTWAPAGPRARAALTKAGARALLDEDWTRVLDVEAWEWDRLPAAGAIGRTAGVNTGAWPRSKSDILAAYPDDGERPVRILGDASGVTRKVKPQRWRVHPAGSLRRRDLLARIDFYVELHATALAPSRAMLEAVANGVAVIGSPWVADALGEAIVPAEPGEVAEIVAKLSADRPAYELQAERARAFARARLGQASLQARMRALIGEPSARPPQVRKLAARRPRRRILFVSSNGAGVGHLMRLMAIARRAGEDVEPVFFTMSQAVQAVREMGYPVEYLASHHYARLPGPLWHPHLRQRMTALIDLYKPSAVVFDGTVAYRGLVQAMRLHPHLPFIWSRRAMWKPALGQNALAQIGEFGLVIEPGEYAESRDTGATVPIRAQTVRVGPVLYHDPGEALTASEAKNALGLDPLRPAALIQLGAGNINDISSALSIVVRRLLQDENLQVCVASSIIGIRETPAFARVKQISVYPLAKYLRAFDFAITAAGYNSYHETIAAGVPAIFVPNLDTALDNQAARASYAEETGVGLALEQVDETSVDRVAQAILDPARRAAMAQRARDRAPINGAADAMAAIERFVAEWETAGTGLRPDAERPLGSGARRIDPGGAQDMSFGRAKPKSASRVFVRRVWMRATRSIRTTLKRRLRIARMVLAGIDSTAARAVRIPVSPGPDEDIVDAAWQAVVMIQIWHPTEEALAEIVANVARLRRSRRSFRPLFVTDADQFGAFRRAGFLFEYLMPPRAWARLDHPLSWSEYRWRRVALLMRTYRPEHVISGSTWEQLEPSLLGAVLDPIAD